MTGSPTTFSPDAGAQTIGPYRVHELLGAGGMGEVYRVTTEEGAVLALKVIRQDLLEKTEIRRRFLREARAAARLVHPNIAQLMDFGTHEGRYFMAMELVSGRTLGEWRSQPPDGETFIEVFDQVLSALAYAHARGVVHRDLKPDNVLLTFDPEGRPVAKLLDFGVAHFRDDNPAEYGMEQALVGTPAYMSPEQALKSSDVSPSSDIYAVGIMLFELLTGELPFTGKSAAGTLMAHLKKPIPALELREGYDYSGPLENVLHRFLAKDPSRRYMFAADARADLATCEVIGSGRRAHHSGSHSSVETQQPTLVTADKSGEAVLPHSSHFGLFSLRDAPFVDRYSELRALHDFAESTLAEGRGGALFVAGEMGLGKTRLVQRFREEIEESGRMQVWAGEYSGAGADPGVREAFRRGLGVAGMTSAEMEQRVHEIMARHQVSDPWEGEALLEYLRGDAVDRDHRLLSSENVRSALLERVIARECERRPVMLLVENLHLADEGPLRLIDWMLSSASQNAPWIIVATYRPEQIPSSGPIAEMLGLFEQRVETDRVKMVRLGRMGLRDVQNLVRRCVPMDDELADVIAARAAGIPLFAVELVRNLVESGRLEGYGEVPSPEEVLKGMPDGLGALLRTRLEEAGASIHTDDRALEIWERLAFLGQRVPFRLGVEMLRVEGIRDAEVILNHAVNGGLLTNVLLEDEDGVIRFENGLLRDALTERAGEHGRSQELHRRAAEAKVRFYFDAIDEHAVEIAQHYEEATLNDRAAQFYIRAAEHARRSHLYTIALESYQAIENILEDERNPAEELRVKTMLGQAEVYLQIADYERASRAAMQARFFESLSGDFSLPEATRILAEVAHRTGNIRQARAMYQVALKGFDRTANLTGTAHVQYGLGQLALSDGRVHEAEGAFRAARELFEAAGNLRGQASAIAALGMAAYQTGLHDEALSLTANARKLLQESDDRQGAARTLITLGEIQIARGQDLEAVRSFERANEELLAVGDRRGAAEAQMMMGRVLLNVQRVEEAKQQLLDAESALAGIGDMVLLSICRLAIAKLEAEEGLWPPAFEAIDAALERDSEERIDDPRFVELLVDLARQAIFVGHEEIARKLLQTAAWKLSRIGADSRHSDRVDEVEYLLHELDSAGDEMEGVTDFFLTEEGDEDE